MSIEWNGDGLPPVGCFCEGYFPRFGSLKWEWQNCLVLWQFANECAVKCIHTGTLHYCDEFRTEENRKRHEALYALERLDIDSDVTIRVLDAIAAGQIPHITLK
jgi:hypothetical protein